MDWPCKDFTQGSTGEPPKLQVQVSVQVQVQLQVQVQVQVQIQVQVPVQVQVKVQVQVQVQVQYLKSGTSPVLADYPSSCRLPKRREGGTQATGSPY